MANASEWGAYEGPLIEKEFSKSPDPFGQKENNVDYTETKAPKEANVETTEEG
jgi:hypothetical protein